MTAQLPLDLGTDAGSSNAEAIKAAATGGEKMEESLLNMGKCQMT